MPQLQDPNFRRSVMLLIHHDEEGTFGLVLNRPAEIRADDLCESLDLRWGGDPEASISWGGPVQPNTGWVLFNETLSEEAELEEITEVRSGLLFAGSLDVLRRVVVAPPSDLRVFLGYAGWGPGQLESEMAQGAWLVATPTPDIVFDVEPDEMWEHVVRGLGVEPASLVPTSGVH